MIKTKPLFRLTQRTHKKVLLRWTLTYLAILMIPTISFFYGFNQTVHVVKEQTSEASQMLLNSVAAELDADLTAMNEAYAFLLKNEDFAATKRAAQLDTSFYSRYAYGLVHALGQYTSSGGNDIGIVLYYTQKDYLITQGGSSDLRSYYYYQQSIGSTLSYDAWKAMLSAEYTPLQYQISSYFRTGSTSDCIVLACSLRGSYERINLFITIPVTSLEKTAAKLDDRYLMLTTRSGDALTVLGADASPIRLDPSIASGATVHGDDGCRYICDYTPSSVNDWYYAVVATEEIYWSQLKTLRTLIMLASGVSLALGILLAAIFLEQNYRPVDKLAQLADPAVPHRNEFELIEHAFRNLSDETHTMRDTLNRQAQQLRGAYLLSLLKGRRSALTGSDFNTHFEIAAPGELFLMTVLSVGENEEALRDYHNELEYENMNLFAADNVFAELMTPLPYYKVEDGRLLIYLLHLTPDQAAEWHRKCSSLLGRMCTLFTEQMHVPLTIVVSEETDTLDRLCYLYRDATDALEYQNTIGSSGILYARDLKEQASGSSLREEYVQELTSVLAAGSPEDADQLCARIYADIGSASFELFRIRLMEQLNTILNGYNDLIADPDLRQRLVLRMERVITAPDTEALRSAFSDLLQFACSTVHAVSIGANSQLVSKICTYVRAHYADDNLNISSIAAAFNRNPQSVSRVFHAQMQKGLLDFINDVRIEHARKLMADEAFSLEEVSARVGFSNVRTFRRVFSRAVGAPPSSFRSGTQKEE